MFLSLAQNRRSIRKYSDKQVEPEKIDSIVEAVLRAPTSRGRNSWEFVIVTDPGLLDKLSRSRPHGASHLKDAVLGIVVLGNPQISDVWIEDASIASIYIHLAATALDLGSCWIQIRERQHNDTQTAEGYIAEVLNLAAHLKVESIIAIGYPAESKSAHPKEGLPYDKVSLNNYGAPYSAGP
ncbi:MAG: nitroreductase family protein [Desulfobacterales bacterium]|jgi:nitroreductase|nr:nitroreductase family protein [Desulfobacterales bacterium]